MKSFFLLFKVQLLGLFSFNKLLHSAHNKEERRQAAVVFSTFMLGYVALVLLSLMATFGAAVFGISDILPVLTLSLTALIILFLTVFEAYGALFSFKDYDLVMSLPIKPQTVILSRLAMLYVLNLLFAVVVMLPSVIAGGYFDIIIHGYFESRPFKVWLFQITGIFLAPLAPITIAAVCCAVIMAAAARFKYSNIAHIILSLLIMPVIIYFVTRADVNNPEWYAEQITVLGERAAKMYPLAGLYGKAVTNGDTGAFVIFAGISVLSVIAFAALLSVYYAKLNTLAQARANRVLNYTFTPQKAGTPLAALIKKELRLLLSSSAYASNTCLTLFMLVSLSVSALFVDVKGFITQIEEQSGGLPAAYLLNLLPFAASFFVGITPSTASAISLEGKSRWLMLTAPVSVKTIYASKTAAYLILSLPACVISGVLLSAVFRLSISRCFFMIAIPSAYALFAGVLGLFFNIMFPKFDYKSEFHVVKNSAASLFTAFTAAVVCGALLSFNMIFTHVSLIYQSLALIVILGASYVLFGIICEKRLNT